MHSAQTAVPRAKKRVHERGNKPSPTVTFGGGNKSQAFQALLDLAAIYSAFRSARPWIVHSQSNKKTLNLNQGCQGTRPDQGTRLETDREMREEKTINRHSTKSRGVHGTQYTASSRVESGHVMYPVLQCIITHTIYKAMSRGNIPYLISLTTLCECKPCHVKMLSRI